MQNKLSPYTLYAAALAVGFAILVIGGFWLLMLPHGESAMPLGTETPVPTIIVQEPTTRPSHTPEPTATHTLAPTVAPTTTYTSTNRPTQTPSFTTTHTNTPSWTPTPTTTLSSTPTLTVTSSITPSPTRTRTPTSTPTMTFTPVYGAPKAVDLMETEYSLLNFLLIGSDRRPGQRDFRTDAMMVVSLNQETGTINLLSIPRDLYVYIPQYGYERINTAVLWGELNNWPGGGGVALLKETIRHNLGIRIDYYAMVNFDGFTRIIDALDGIDIAVPCPLSDYKLSDPDFNPALAANYEWTTVPVGIHHFDGETALWYARSRATTSDFDRNYRQQALIGAIWQAFNEKNLWDTVPGLWSQFDEIVETDITLPTLLELAPYGVSLQPRLIQHFYINRNMVTDYTTDGGAQVLKPHADAVADLMKRFYLPPTLNTLFQDNAHVEVINQSGREDLEMVAIAVLNELGFITTTQYPEDREILNQTHLIDFRGNTKGSSVTILSRLFSIEAEHISVEIDSNTDIDYQMILGSSFSACLRVRT